MTVEKGPGDTSGTLTFLFSDLRGYTAYVESRGDAAAAELIADYRRTVRAQGPTTIVASAGTLSIADTGNHRIRKMSLGPG